MVRAVRELPFSTADVALLEDMELLEPHSQAATAAVMKVCGHTRRTHNCMPQCPAQALVAAAQCHAVNLVLTPSRAPAACDALQAADTAAAADGGGAWEPADAPAVMAASAAAAREAAAAAHYAWMQGYELTMAQRQEWKGPGVEWVDCMCMCMCMHW